MRFKVLFMLSYLCFVSGIVTAEPIEVGAGVNTATVYIEWSDGFNIEFLVYFGNDINDTTNGIGLLDIIEANNELITVRQDGFMNTISYQDHIDVTPIDRADEWNYWVNDAGSKNPWQLYEDSAGTRIVANGDSDAWVYGSSGSLPNMDVLEVGIGVNKASVYIEWSDGFTAEFIVNYGTSETETTTGLGLLDIIEADTDLMTLREESAFGVFVTTIAYQGHSDVTPDDWSGWWNYWTNNAGSRYPWESSIVGASSRVVSHGDADGWIFGSYEKPVPASENPFLEGYGQYIFDANDFATTWIEYEPNGMIYDWITYLPFNDPNTALGRPVIDTSGDGWELPIDANVPVVPIYPAIRAHELVHLGEDGSITLGFNHPVCDDMENPYGIDFIVFGNCFQMINGTENWSNGDPRLITVGSSGGIEPGIVSVSQDGITWYSFTNDPTFMSDDPNFIKLAIDEQNGPFCDGFASTLGRVYDPCFADTTIGNWNHWWAEPTNPTLPLNPNFSYESFKGMSVARLAETYGDSAGGTGYDLNLLDLPNDPNTGMKWFKYIRIDDARGSGTTEIDAVSDVSCPGDYRHPAPIGDLNNDYRVNIEDIAIVEGFLGQEVNDPDNPAMFADLNGDGTINQEDIDIVIDNFGVCTWNCPIVEE